MLQVYAVGIGNIYLDELRFIASDPDIDHVFVLNSFNDAPKFVDFLSFTACDSECRIEVSLCTMSCTFIVQYTLSRASHARISFLPQS